MGRWCATRLLGVCAVVVASAVAQLWAATVRCRSDGLDPLQDLWWSSVWLWSAIVLTAWLAYGLGLAWIERDRSMRSLARLRRDGAP